MLTYPLSARICIFSCSLFPVTLQSLLGTSKNRTVVLGRVRCEERSRGKGESRSTSTHPLGQSVVFRLFSVGVSPPLHRSGPAVASCHLRFGSPGSLVRGPESHENLRQQGEDGGPGPSGPTSPPGREKTCSVLHLRKGGDRTGWNLLVHLFIFLVNSVKNETR